jgi:hypothetical protein
MKISQAKVEHKKLIICSYKNNLYRLCVNTKEIIIKDLHSNFVQLLVQKLVIT